MFEALFAAFALLATVAVIPNRLVELVKPSIHRRFPREDQADLRLVLVLLVSLVASLAVAIVLNFNVFTGFPDNPYLSQIPPLVGVLGTGVLLMFGANGWHKLGEAVESRQANTAMLATTLDDLPPVRTHSGITSAQAEAIGRAAAREVLGFPKPPDRSPGAG